MPAWLVSRPWRVGALGLAVLLMAAADLVMTIEFLTVGAMWEGNPLARSVMSSGSAGALTAWKVASLIPAAYVMTRHGGRLIVELAAWVCFLAMAIVMVRWSIYCGITDTMSFIDSSLAAASDPDWVSWQR